MKHKESDLQQFSNFVIFHTADGKINVDVLFKHDTVWLTQKLIAELFEKGRSTITEHLNQIFADGELDVNVVCRKFRHTTPHGAIEGKTQQSESKYYSLRAVVAVGYRVNSHRAIEFRKWATQILHEYIIKGFAMDDERLKNLGGGGYWKELLQRIRDIRASEKVFYRQVLDIYATSFDYDPRANVSIEFFQKVQNKIHYAVHGQTAAELIYDRVDAKKQFMSLQTFPGSRPYLKDAVVAKNYLNEKELRSLGQLVSGYLDFAERQAERKQPMT
ncbi:MAG TPA: cell filamentation protein Fic, partial [Candidatus Wirthbacteria bacterium]|nr:cell filamentation protein Fic [Candidatus Wirthbacteria bacterium]